MKCFRYNIIAVLLMLPLLVSCRQELCYDHYPVLNVNFTWEQEWERDYGHHHADNWDHNYFGCHYDDLRPGTSEWINMISYYDDGRHTEGFVSPDGKSFIVEAGEKRSILLYNGDTEYIVLSDVASLNDARATATPRSRAAAYLAAMQEIHGTSRTTNPPDVLYASYIENVPGLENHESHTMPINMQPLVYTYHVNFEFEYGIEHVALARGALGGMAESVFLRTGVTSEQTSIILFDCEVSSNICRAQVRSFGVPGFPDTYYVRAEGETMNRPGSLTLEVMMRNGKTLEFSYDITDQLEKQPRGGVIKISGLKIEDEQAQGTAGFDIDVNGWNDPGEIIDIPMGSQPGAK